MNATQMLSRAERGAVLPLSGSAFRLQDQHPRTQALATLLKNGIQLREARPRTRAQRMNEHDKRRAPIDRDDLR